MAGSLDELSKALSGCGAGLTACGCLLFLVGAVIVALLVFCAL